MHPKEAPIGEELLDLRARLAEWRKSHPRHSPLPEEMWAMAVELARRHGLYRTARALPMDYFNLRKRLNGAAPSARGLIAIRYQMVKAFLEDHNRITPRQCRELLGLGESASAQVVISRYLRRWSSEGGFLVRRGSGPSTHYVLREKLSMES